MRQLTILALTIFAFIFGLSSGISAADCELFPSNCISDGENCGEDINGGCQMPVPFFTPIECADSVCGTIWAENADRDADWFELILTEPTWVTLTGIAQFPLFFGFGDTADCWQLSGLDPYAQSDVTCSLMSVSRLAGPGNYWIYVTNTEFYNYPCADSNEYWFTVHCASGDIDGDGVIDSLDICPFHFDPDQLDSDDDGFGDACPCDCRPGDVNGDTMTNIFDITYLINGIYGGYTLLPYGICSGDPNGSQCMSNIFDVTYLISFLYKGGPPPVAHH